MATGTAGVLANIELTQGPCTEELSRLLQCPICQEIMMTPIKQCQNGHSVCNSCSLKLAHCGFCRGAINEIQIRNFALESIVDNSIFNCENSQFGCPQQVKGNLMLSHVQDGCKFRPVKCQLGSRDSCGHTLSKMSNYLNHLLTTHKLWTRATNTGVFTLSCHVRVPQQQNAIWSPALIEFDGQFFALNVFKYGPTMNFSVAIFGEEEEALKYKINIRIINQQEQVVKKEETIPVISVRKCSSQLEILKTVHFTLQSSQLNLMGQTSVTEEAGERIKLTTCYKIIRKVETKQMSTMTDFDWPPQENSSPNVKRVKYDHLTAASSNDQKRPPQSSYFMWMRMNKDDIKNKYPNVNFSTICGQLWKDIPIQEKLIWDEMTRQANLDYERGESE